jgi:hypothetical protein
MFWKAKATAKRYFGKEKDQQRHPVFGLGCLVYGNAMNQLENKREKTRAQVEKAVCYLLGYAEFETPERWYSRRLLEILV